MATAPATTRLVADVGGTNTRIALYDYQDRRLCQLANYRNRDFRQFQDILAHWLTQFPLPVPEEACIAVAALPAQDQVTMSNMDWSFSGQALMSRFGFSTLSLINDFEANAYSLPHLAAGQRTQLQAGSHQRARRATMGPGTGLGGATIDTMDADARVSASEAGHMGLSPGTDLELELFRLLLPRYGNIYGELLVSGPGLQRLYEALAEIHDRNIEPIDPAQISGRAQTGEDSLCTLALTTFCGLLGSICGDFVLATGSYGGMYLAGGIVPRMIPFLSNSDFLARFHNKGAMASQLKSVGVYAITEEHPGLIGAAYAPLRQA